MLNRYAEALQSYKKVLEFYSRKGVGQDVVARFQTDISLVYLELQRPLEAVALAKQALL